MDARIILKVLNIFDLATSVTKSNNIYIFMCQTQRAQFTITGKTSNKYILNIIRRTTHYNNIIFLYDNGIITYVKSIFFLSNFIYFILRKSLKTYYMYTQCVLSIDFPTSQRCIHCTVTVDDKLRGIFCLFLENNRVFNNKQVLRTTLLNRYFLNTRETTRFILADPYYNIYIYI